MSITTKSFGTNDKSVTQSSFLKEKKNNIETITSYSRKNCDEIATVFDVAKYILGKVGTISTMKLQKLCYYAQAWSLVWDEAPLFPDKIEAWANGPVIPALFEKHKGRHNVNAHFFRAADTSHLSFDQKATIDNVLDFYGNQSSQWLSDLAHSEAPWLDARKGIDEGEPGSTEITQESMATYYGSL